IAMSSRCEVVADGSRQSPSRVCQGRRERTSPTQASPRPVCLPLTTCHAPGWLVFFVTGRRRRLACRRLAGRRRLRPFRRNVATSPDAASPDPASWERGPRSACAGSCEAAVVRRLVAPGRPRPSRRQHLPPQLPAPLLLPTHTRDWCLRPLLVFCEGATSRLRQKHVFAFTTARHGSKKEMCMEVGQRKGLSSGLAGISPNQLPQPGRRILLDGLLPVLGVARNQETGNFTHAACEKLQRQRCRCRIIVKIVASNGPDDCHLPVCSQGRGRSRPDRPAGQPAGRQLAIGRREKPTGWIPHWKRLDARCRKLACRTHVLVLVKGLAAVGAHHAWSVVRGAWTRLLRISST
ncbi:hypothetical protein BCR44DRAFT_1427727, partial [Catenaria anguillulae PL171]